MLRLKINAKFYAAASLLIINSSNLVITACHIVAGIYMERQLIEISNEIERIKLHILLQYLRANYLKVTPKNLGYVLKYRNLTIEEIENLVTDLEKRNQQLSTSYEVIYVTIVKKFINELTILRLEALDIITDIVVNYNFNAINALSSTIVLSTEKFLIDNKKFINETYGILYNKVVSDSLELSKNTFRYRILRYIQHIFEKTIFVMKEKYAFNKAWINNKDLPKYNIVPSTIETVEGFTLSSKYAIFVNGVIHKNTKRIDHKFNFVEELNFMEDVLLSVDEELSLVESTLKEQWISLSINLLEKEVEKQQKFIDLLETSFRLKLYKVKQNGYNFDIFSFNDELYSSYNGINKIYDSITATKIQLEEINVKKGYISSTDLFNKDAYPIVSDMIKLLIDEGDFNKLNNYFKSLNYIWLKNIIMLNIYSISLKCLYYLKSINNCLAPNEFLPLAEEQKLKEIISRFEVLSNWCYNMFDNSIKQHLIKRNPTISSDIIAGFDTEYLPLDWGHNQLLSAQVSASHILKLTIPIFKEYNFEGVNTLSTETYLKSLPRFSAVDFVQDFITAKINECRYYKFQNHDTIMRKLVNKFSDNANIIDNKNNVILAFNKATIKNLLVLGANEEQLELNFNTLINLITKMFDRANEEEKLCNQIKYANYNDLETGILIENKVADSWNNSTLKQEEPEIIILTNKENESISGENSPRDNKSSMSFTLKGLLLEEEDLLHPDVSHVPHPSTPECNPIGFSLERRIRGVPQRDKTFTSIKVVINRNIYLAAHYNSADLTMLNDWNSVSYRNVDIAKKCFTSLSTPVKYNGIEKIHLRDTYLLASATARSLDAIAYAYGMKKIDVSQTYKENMDELLRDDRKLFIEYAMTDSLITLVHMLFINDFSFSLGSVRIPNTLGTLSSRYIKNKWRQDNYKGYQIDVNYPLGDVRQSHTPKGIQFGHNTIEFANLFLGSYRGGRNECFRYGIDKSSKWYDYDLTSCYSTIMSMMGQPEYEKTEDQSLAELSESLFALMGQPDYNKGTWISPETNLKELDLLKSYSALKIKFNLPDEISYPPFPVTLDKSISVYPSSGIALVTGAEYLTGKAMLEEVIDRFKLKKNMYKIEILYGAYIPFKKDVKYVEGEKIETMSYSPFYEVINELQENRRKWKKTTGKGSAMERIYKDLGNMLYGKIVCGIANKKTYDVRTESMKTVLGNDLSNPILGTWITGYVRALIAELLFKVDLLGGQVVSCTTDGFVTDIENLEDKIIEKFGLKGSLLQEYRNIRMKLSGLPEALEIKTSVNGIVQWTTRGQLSLEETGIPISAVTGYQKSRNHKENLDTVQESLISGNKILFIQKQLTGGLDCYKKSKHVSMTSQQRTYKTVFDSKRFVINSQESMLKTRPFNDVSEALLSRNLMINFNTTTYSSEYSVHSVSPSTNAIQETVKLIIRMICSVYNYNVPVEMKFNIASILNSIDSSIKEQYVLDLFSVYYLNKGNIVTKLPVFRNVSLFLKELHDKLSSLASKTSLYDGIIEGLLVYFDNFNILPRSNEALKTMLIEKLRNVPAEKLIIIEGKNSVTVTFK